MSAISLPRVMRVGAGTILELPAALAQLGLKAPAIITDAFLVQSGAASRVEAILAEAGMSARVFSGVVPDPTTTAVDEATAFVKAGTHDCVIGFGGGSSIDTAKAVAVLASRGGTMRELKAPHQEDKPGMPIVAIPTTAGTGSEATRFTIITDDASDEKMLCVGLAYMPVLAIVDYETTITAPRRLTADTGIDALTHAIEAYVSRLANPFSDAMALSAMRAIWPNLRRVYDEPSNRAAREAMMIGSLQAGIAFSNASVALVHGMSRPIGAHFHVAHGLSNAMLLPVVTEWSAASASGRYADCARAMGVASPDDADDIAVSQLVTALKDINRDLEVPSPKTFGIEEARWNDLLPLMAAQALGSGSPGNNPRVPDADEIQALYRKAWA
ncbi:iron-containing alcohol dehydrogenase [Cereibacter sp. SYSU M97828]|nr:iron-containing alcohol dehydrogenase [Cereibacter flavus]